MTFTFDSTNSINHFYQIVMAYLFRKFIHFSFERSNKILGVFTFSFDELDYSLEIDWIKCRVYLIQDIKECRFALLQSHQDTKANHCLLPSWKFLPIPCHLSLILERDHNSDWIFVFYKTSWLVSNLFKPDICPSINCDSSKDTIELFFKFSKNFIEIHVFLFLTTSNTFLDLSLCVFQLSIMLELLLILFVITVDFRK